jgi:hypothetical protein
LLDKKSEQSNLSNSTASRTKSATTQQQPLKYSAHYTGGGAQDDSKPQRRAQDMSALDRLKLIQSNFKQKWQGIECESCGRPGTSNFVNQKRAVTVIESAL